MTVVLDASALLAYLQDEPGSEVIDRVLAESVMSSVNWSEVMQKSIAAEVSTDGMLDELQALGLNIELFTVEDAELAGKLWKQTYMAGLSLGDRACLSLGMRLRASILTSDRSGYKICPRSPVGMTFRCAIASANSLATLHQRQNRHQND